MVSLDALEKGVTSDNEEELGFVYELFSCYVVAEGVHWDGCAYQGKGSKC